MSNIIETKQNESVKIYVNNAGSHVKVTEIPAIGGIIIGSNATASNNVRIFRSAAGKIQIVKGDDTTAEGSVSSNPADIQIGILGCTGLDVNGTISGITGAFNSVNASGKISGITGVFNGILGTTGSFVSVIGTTGVFNNLTVSVRLTIPTSAPSSPQNGDIWVA
jgi:hypothetical protein